MSKTVMLKFTHGPSIPVAISQRFNPQSGQPEVPEVTIAVEFPQDRILSALDECVAKVAALVDQQRSESESRLKAAINEVNDVADRIAEGEREMIAELKKPVAPAVRQEEQAYRRSARGVLAVTAALSELAANFAVDSIGQLLNGGFIDFFAGERPESTAIASDDSNLLARLEFGSMAFDLASGGIARMNSVQPAMVLMTGRVRWARLRAIDNAAVMDVSVGGTPRYDIEVTNVDFRFGAELAADAIALKSAVI